MNKTIIEHSWIPLILVACASFIITLDSTFMNVSISQVVADLNTNVTTVQMIMTFYTLITAAFMLLSTKLQDIVGKKRLFLIGAVLYGIGTSIAAISQTDTMLFIGWAVIEGLAGALMTPATVAIISGTYSGQRRTFALAIESVMAALSAAVGPLFGGIMTTFLSWRYGFACELIIVIFILVMHNKIPDFSPTESKDDLDITGTIISFIGLVLFVIGILMMSEYVTTSVVVIILGLFALTIFALFEIKRKRNGKVPLLDMDLFKDKNLRLGATIILLSYIVMGGGLFAVSLYLQSVLDLNAFNTGLTTLPLTLGLLIFAVAAPSLTGRFNHKTLMALGSIISIIGCLMLVFKFTIVTTMLDLMPGMFILGSGLGFIMALSTDIALVNIPEESQNNSSGIVTTSQTLGESMGTAIIGIVLIIGIFAGISDAVDFYAPEHSDDDQFHQDIFDYFQKSGNVNMIKSQNSKVVNTANLIIQNSMGFVMVVTTILMTIVFVLTLRLNDNSIQKE